MVTWSPAQTQLRQLKRLMGMWKLKAAGVEAMEVVFRINAAWKAGGSNSEKKNVLIWFSSFQGFNVNTVDNNAGVH